MSLRLVAGVIFVSAILICSQIFLKSNQGSNASPQEQENSAQRNIQSELPEAKIIGIESESQKVHSKKAKRNPNAVTMKEAEAMLFAGESKKPSVAPAEEEEIAEVDELIKDIGIYFKRDVNFELQSKMDEALVLRGNHNYDGALKLYESVINSGTEHMAFVKAAQRETEITICRQNEGEKPFFENKSKLLNRIVEAIKSKRSRRLLSLVSRCEFLVYDLENQKVRRVRPEKVIENLVSILPDFQTDQILIGEKDITLKAKKGRFIQLKLESAVEKWSFESISASHSDDYKRLLQSKGE